MERIQVLLETHEKESLRRLAAERGMSLSAWIREAALRRAQEDGDAPRLRTVEALRAFFADRDLAEQGREPDWDQHLEVLRASKVDGAGAPSVAPAPGSSETPGRASGAARGRVSGTARRTSGGSRPRGRR